MMSKLESYMFREHSASELVAWTRRLSYFRFVRASGGLANDGDFLLAEIPLTPELTLLNLLTNFGWVIDSARTEMLESLPEERWNRINARMEDPVLFQNPNIHVSIFKQKGLRIEIFGAAGDPYSVTNTDVVLAEAVEVLMKPLNFNFVESDHRYRFSAKTFPTYFT